MKLSDMELIAPLRYLRNPRLKLCNNPALFLQHITLNYDLELSFRPLVWYLYRPDHGNLDYKVFFEAWYSFRGEWNVFPLLIQSSAMLSTVWLFSDKQPSILPFKSYPFSISWQLPGDEIGGQKTNLAADEGQFGGHSPSQPVDFWQDIDGRQGSPHSPRPSWLGSSRDVASEGDSGKGRLMLGRED